MTTPSPTQSSPTPRHAEALASLTGLTKSFGELAAVDGLDLVVDPGLVHGFLGPNGAGKSTAIRCLLGLYAPTSGTVDLLGHDPRKDPQVTRRVSYVPGDVVLWPNFTGQQALDALAGLRGSRDEARERELIDAFALDPSKKVRSYSKGNRQKVMLVAAFSARTELLVLDEPTSGLDPLMEQTFAQCVREAAHEGRGVLLSSHDLAEVERLCDQITIIKDGQLVESGRLTELRHLAASTIQARLPHRSVELARRIEGLDAHWEDDRITVQTPHDRVADVLAAVVAENPAEVTCSPASLEDLFLRHYEVAAR
ncbi:ABC transporter ATP-binding protein [Luteococcus sp. Sow4_B9]|uniref:ABC transporter ATP-binding protein n=1 Tax=Luteococcus sp. Sow4_B9 TaxID=3438792 RepID=UPI003F9A4DE7